MSKPTDGIDRAAFARRLEEDLAIVMAATPGPWRNDAPSWATPWTVGRELPWSEQAQREVICTLDVRQGNTEDAPRSLEIDYRQVIADARFIGAARSGWEYAIRVAQDALADLERARTEVDSLRQQLRKEPTP